MRINEIFLSIQGEGPHAGLLTSFIRTQGCYVKCSYCDTEYAQDHKGGTELSVEEVVNKARDLLPHYKHWVCITGGEPLLQSDAVHELVILLHKYGYLVEIETSGVYPKPWWWSKVDCWIADIKCPSSGAESQLLEWYWTRPCDCVKYVVDTNEDIEYAEKMIKSNACRNPMNLLSPAIDGLKLHDSFHDMMRMGYGNEDLIKVVELQKRLHGCRVRYSLQIHKFIWGVDLRGV